MATGRVPTTANSPLTTKGDLFTYDTSQARLAVGSNGETLVADSSTSTGLRWQGNYAAGKNKIINGDFNIWQRGTTFTSPASDTFNSDRFFVSYDGTITTHTVSRQTFTPGTAPVAGYEGQFFWRWAITTNGTSNYRLLFTKIENVQTLAGQTATLSFWIKADTNRTLTSAVFGQNFGSGGSSGVETSLTLSTTALTSSWQRITATVSVPSISGKTVGTSSFAYVYLNFPSAGTFDVWGMQLEAGSVATAFQTATGTLAGELAACQRYFLRLSGSASAIIGTGYQWSSTASGVIVTTPVTLRTTPSLAYSALSDFSVLQGATGVVDPTALSVGPQTQNGVTINITIASGGSRGYAQFIELDNTNATFSLSSEL